MQAKQAARKAEAQKFQPEAEEDELHASATPVSLPEGNVQPDEAIASGTALAKGPNNKTVEDRKGGTFCPPQIKPADGLQLIALLMLPIVDVLGFEIGSILHLYSFPQFDSS